MHRSGRWPNGCRSLVNSLLVISTTSRSATWKVFGRRPKNSTRAACAPQSQSARSRVSHVFVVRNCDIICVICAIRSFNPRRTRRAGMPSGRREARKGERSGDRELKRREDFHGRRQARSTPLRAGSATTEFQFKEKAPGRFSPPGANTRVALDRPGDAVLLCVVLYTVGSMRISRRGDLVAAASSQQSSISHFPQKKFVIARPRSPAPGPGALPKQRSCCPCNGGDGNRQHRRQSCEG